jgi:hypothetical protein
VLEQLGGPTRSNSWRTYYDYRLGGAVRLGAFDFLVEWTGGGPGRTYYNGQFHSKDALVAGVNFFF